MRESELYAIWANQRLNHDLYTISGQAVRVIYPGNLNSDKGADFKDAYLKIDESDYHGDVEIHIKKRDWLNHKHHIDPEYNKVILHLIWENDSSKVLTQAENQIPTILLSQFYEPEQDVKDKIAYNCSFFSGLDKYQLKFLLYEYGKKRFIIKSKQIKESSYLFPYEDILYSLIAQVLVNPNNKHGMKVLAQSIHKRDLKSLSSSKLSAYIEKKLTEFSLIGDKSQQKDLWNKFRVRPASQPKKRVRDFIALRWQYRMDNLAILLWDTFNRTNTLKDLLKDLTNILNIGQSKNRFGQELIKTIAYNAILPFIYSIIITSSDKKNLAKINNYIKEFPKIADNRIINSFKNKISEYQTKNFIQKEVYYQGLHYLMNSYCQRHNCLECHKEKEEYLTIRE